MENQIISLETAKILKQTDFSPDVWDSDLCKNVYWKDQLSSFDAYGYSWQKNEDYYFLAPSQPLLQKWLRDKHNIHLIVIPYEKNYSIVYKVEIGQLREKTKELTTINWTPLYNRINTYEEALEKGLQKGLEILIQ